MKKEKILHVAVAIVLVTSAFGIMFAGVAESQGNDSEIYTESEESVQPEEFSEESWVSTLRDTNLPGIVPYHGEVLDEDGNPPEEPREIEVFCQNGDWDYNGHETAADGSFSGEFEIDTEGEYTIGVWDLQDNQIIAESEFSVQDATVQISVEPDYDVYGQGQEIEIELDGDYDDPIDLTIDHMETGERMEDAFWHDIVLGDSPWTTEHQIPEDAADGSYWVNATDSDDDTLVGQYILEVQRYYLDAEAERDEYLPREEVTVYYNVIENLDGSEFTNVDVEYLVEYTHEEDGLSTISRTAEEDDEFTFELPRYAQMNSYFDIQIWANSTDGEHEVQETIPNLYVTEFDLDLELDQTTYLQEETLYLDITTGPETEVELELSDDDDQTITERTIETDQNGLYTTTFDLSDLELGHYNISGGAVWDIQREITASDNEWFEIVEEEEEYTLHLHSDKSTYYVGESGTVFYQVSDQYGEEVEDPNVVYTIRSSIFRGPTYEKGHGEDGEINFDVPDNLDAAREDLIIDVHDGTEADEYSGSILLSVSPGEILLNPDEREYEAGDTIEFEYSFAGIGSEDIDSLEYRITTPDGTLVEIETPSDGSFSFEIPEIAEDYYDAELIVMTDSGYRLTASETIYKITAFHFMVEITTDPDHITGFEPGDELEIEYSLVSNTEEPLPETFTIAYSFIGYDENYFHTEETEGTFTITVPELKCGEHIIGFSTEYGESIQTVEVENDPSIMDRIVVGNFTVTHLGMSILILIALILGALAFTRTKRSRKGTTAEHEPRKSATESPGEEEPVGKVEGSDEEFVIEEGEAEPEDHWSSESQIEPGERE